MPVMPFDKVLILISIASRYFQRTFIQASKR